MPTVMDLCFLCTKDYNCVPVDSKIVSQVEYFLPEITIINLGIPLRICSVCDGALYAFSKFKQLYIESSKRLEASIKDTQSPLLQTKSTPQDVQLYTERDFLNPATVLQTDIIEDIIIPEQKELKEPNVQLQTDVNSGSIEQVFIKEEEPEEIPQDTGFLLMQNIFNEEFGKKSENDRGSQPEHSTEPYRDDDSATSATRENVWEGNSADSEEDTNMETTEQYTTMNKNMMCNLCGKSFTYKSDYMRHMKSHAGIRDFHCNVCTKSFMHKSKLVAHMKNHTGAKVFNCETCNKTFAYRSDLTRHKKIHSGVKSFECETCNKSFMDKSNLAKHIKTHLGIKEFQCNICNKWFRQKTHLDYHVKTHSATKEFVCEVCNRPFRLKTHLVTHMKTHTGQQ